MTEKKLGFREWKAKYYPIPAHKCPKKKALESGLLKWLGLRQSVLEKYGLVIDDGVVCDYNEEKDEIGPTRLFLGADQCALCRHFMERCGWHPSGFYCWECPLYKALGNERCDAGEDAVYWEARDGNVEPIIKALRKALRQQQAAAAAKQKKKGKP